MTPFFTIVNKCHFTAVLNGIICFSIRFCDNSILVSKMSFQAFSFASKKVQGFSSDRKILMSMSSVLFHLQNCVTVFEILIFSQDIWGDVHYVREINLISLGTLLKAFYLPNKTTWKKSETRFCRRKTPENNNAKINIFQHLPCTFLLLKPSAFRQIFFPRIYFSDKFLERQFFSIVNV